LKYQGQIIKMRKLDNIIEKKVFRDDSEIELALMLAKGDIIENQEVTQSSAQHMVEGESRIDIINNRKVTKVNGVLYKEVVKDNEVMFEEIV